MDKQTAFHHLLGQLQTLIADARNKAVRAVDEIQVQTCWQVGQHLVEFMANACCPCWPSN
jgi:hypothetical protein